MAERLASLRVSEADEGVFDPETLEAMGLALEAAWTFVQRCADPRDPEPEVARDLLARDVIAAATEGHHTRVALANEAIRRLRARVLGEAGTARLVRF